MQTAEDIEGKTRDFICMIATPIVLSQLIPLTSLNFFFFFAAHTKNLFKFKKKQMQIIAPIYVVAENCYVELEVEPGFSKISKFIVFTSLS